MWKQITISVGSFLESSSLLEEELMFSNDEEWSGCEQIYEDERLKNKEFGFNEIRFWRLN